MMTGGFAGGDDKPIQEIKQPGAELPGSPIYIHDGKGAYVGTDERAELDGRRRDEVELPG